MLVEIMGLIRLVRRDLNSRFTLLQYLCSMLFTSFQFGSSSHLGHGSVLLLGNVTEKNWLQVTASFCYYDKSIVDPFFERVTIFTSRSQKLSEGWGIEV